MKKIPVKRTLPGNKRTPSNTTTTPKRPSHDLTPTGKPDSAPHDTRADAAATVMSTGEMVHDKTGEVLPKAKAAAQHTVRVETPLKVKTLHTIKVQASPQLARAAGRGRPGPDGLQPQKGGSTTEDSQDTRSATIVVPDVGTAASFRVFVPESGTVASSHGETASVDFPGTAVDGGTVVSCASVSPEPGAGSRGDWSPPDAGTEGILETGTAAVAHDVEAEVVGTSMQDLRTGLMRNMGGDLTVEDESGTAVAQDLQARVVGDFGMDMAATVNGGTSMYGTVAGGDVGKVVGSLGGVSGGYGAHMAMWTPLCLEALEAPFSTFVNPEQAGYVGFANLPNQVHRKSVKKGFEFTLMVVGESGLGKSTLVNSLFLTDLYPERHVPTASEKIQQTVKIDASTVEIEERGVKLRLTVVDTPGFGDSLNSTDCFRSIIRYIDDQFERYLQDESGLNRRHIIDNRVHCCFYFINPSGHGLKPLDVAFMRTVHHKVNIVPVLAKADTLTKLEVTNLKRKILDQIEDYGIKIYPLPDCDSDEDEDYKEQCRQLKNAVPFAVVGANAIIEVKGRKVRGRMYPWGVVEVENPDHCDFIKLRTMLITHMQDLQEVTQETHYENYRAEKLANGGAAPPKPSKSAPPPSQHDGVIDRERELMQKEEELRKMQEKLARMQAEIDMKRPAQQANGNIRTHDL